MRMGLLIHSLVQVAARVEIEFVGISSSPSIALSNANLVNGFQLKAWEKGPVEVSEGKRREREREEEEVL